MKYINRQTIAGFIGNSPELRYMPNGQAVIELRVATAHSWKDRASNQWHKETEWHNCVAYRDDAEKIEFPAESLIEGINSTIYATADDEIRPAMNAPTIPTTDCTGATLPSATRISSRMPLAVASIWLVILSVATSYSSSPWATASPTFLNH